MGRIGYVNPRNKAAERRVVVEPATDNRAMVNELVPPDYIYRGPPGTKVAGFLIVYDRIRDCVPRL
jgi:hypothetical protein